VFAPLRVPRGATGTLAVINLKGKPPFEARKVSLVESLADQASVAIEYARAQTELQKLGLMEERERIAKELHDGIIQSLFAVGMGLQGTALMARSPETAQRIEGAAEDLDGVIRDLRNYIFGLRPGILADRQLEGALRQLADQTETRSNITVHVDVDSGLAAALSGRSMDIVQLTREALSNVTRHAHASNAKLTLSRDGPEALLVIDDDGVGFDPSAATFGNGLRNMRERAASLVGSLDVSSHNGGGTKLIVRFPIRV
jgi:signal transduction histidine kinase